MRDPVRYSTERFDLTHKWLSVQPRYARRAYQERERERERESAGSGIPVLWYPSMKRFISVRVHFQSDQDTSPSGHPGRGTKAAVPPSHTMFLRPPCYARIATRSINCFSTMRPIDRARWFFFFLFFFHRWRSRNFLLQKEATVKIGLSRDFWKMRTNEDFWMKDLCFG